MDLPAKVTSKITNNNRVTIPQNIREVLGVEADDTIQWTVHTDGTISVENSNDNLWANVKEQEEKYGNLSTPEVNWGKYQENKDL